MKTEFKIEKGVPLPVPGLGKSCRYQFRDMEIGDSFMVSGEPNRTMEQIRSRVWGAATYYGSNQKPKVEFATRINHAEKTLRIWRVA